MKIIVGFSGGLDSHCLLHMLQQQTLEFDIDTTTYQILAVHINHGVNAQADAWQQHCQQVCDAMNIAYQSFKLNIVDDQQQGFEAAARAARYKAFAELMQPEDILITAHHKDDQAETFLLQAMRGAGVKGLAAMPDKKPFAQGIHARPLLQWSKQDLLKYADKHQLKWIEDDSNNDCAYSRNFIRHKIMPELQKHWPKATTMLAQSAAYTAEAAELLHELAKIDYDQCADTQGQLLVTKLVALSLPRQKNVVQYWLRLQHCSIPSGKVLQRVFDELIPAADDAMPEVSWQGGTVRRYQQKLYAFTKEQPVITSETIQWYWHKPIELNGYQLYTEQSASENNTNQLPSSVTVRFRQNGEKVKLAEHSQHKALKNLMQQWQVPTWEREQLALIFAGELLIAAPPYYHTQQNTIVFKRRKID